MCFLAQDSGPGTCKSYMDYNKICHIKNRLRQVFFGEIYKERSCLLAVEFARDTIFREAVLCQQTDSPKGNCGETPRQGTSIRPSITGSLMQGPGDRVMVQKGGRNPTDNGRRSSCYIISAHTFFFFLPASSFSLKLQMCSFLSGAYCFEELNLSHFLGFIHQLTPRGKELKNHYFIDPHQTLRLIGREMGWRGGILLSPTPQGRDWEDQSPDFLRW